MNSLKTIYYALSILLGAVFLQSCNPKNVEKTESNLQPVIAAGEVSCDNFVSPCALPDSCNNPICQAEIRGMHRLREDSFNNMVTRYYEGNTIIGDTLQTTEINSKINAGDCGTSHMKFSDDNGPQQNKIDFTVVETLVQANYSIQLFKGIMQLEPTYFVFYKAKKFDKNCNLVDDIVFKAVKEDAAGGAGVVYYGDASDLLP